MIEILKLLPLGDLRNISKNDIKWKYIRHKFGDIVIEFLFVLLMHL